MSRRPLPPEQTAATWRSGTIALVLPVFAVALAAYLPVMQCGFVWNDGDYVTRSDLQSGSGLGRIWFEVGATEQYYPVLHSAFWLEHRLWGEAAAGYHAVNILLHAISACLFVLILRRLWRKTGPLGSPVELGGATRPAPPFEAALFGGLIFALHPVCVESVAWISEQKNTLSTVFYLAAALAYLHFEAGDEIPDADPALPGIRRPLSYLGASVLFVLALLTKTVTATLPATLLIIQWWKRGRLDWRRDVLPLAPWFCLAAASGLFSAWVEKKYVGAEGAAFTLAFAGRFLLAGRVICFYVGKFLWPHPLIFIYPRWHVEPGLWWQYFFPCGVLALAAGCWRARRRTRAPLAAVLLLVAALAPVLGFFNVYGFLFSYVADHWAYLAILPLAAVAAAAWGKWLGQCDFAPWAAAVAILGACAVLTWRQAGAYRDETTLYRAILKLNPAAWLAHSNLGISLATAGRLPEAIAEYEEALRLNPDNAQAHSNLGNAFNRTGRTAEAIDQYQQALRLQPGFAEAHNGLGSVLERDGRMQEAGVEYEEALRLKPTLAEPHINLGNILFREHQDDAAIAQYREGLRLNPASAEAHCGLGTALERKQLIAEAIVQYREALRIAPDLADAHNDLGNALLDQGKTAEAIAQYQEALRVAPHVAEIHRNLAVALYRSGRAVEAAEQFSEALRINPSDVQAQRGWEMARRAVARPN
jgi:tetratricopeptide (TPR) repeat protein